MSVHTIERAPQTLCRIASGGNERYRPTRIVDSTAVTRAIEQRIEAEIFAQSSVYIDSMDEVLLEPLPEDWREHYWDSRNFAEALRRAAYLQSAAGVLHLTHLMDQMIQTHITNKVRASVVRELENANE